MHYMHKCNQSSVLLGQFTALYCASVRVHTHVQCIQLCIVHGVYVSVFFQRRFWDISWNLFVKEL